MELFGILAGYKEEENLLKKIKELAEKELRNKLTQALHHGQGRDFRLRFIPRKCLMVSKADKQWNWGVIFEFVLVTRIQLLEQVVLVEWMFTHGLSL